MEMGVVYALCAGVFWGTSPVLVKRGLVAADVSAATLYQQATILVTLCLAALLEEDLFTGNVTGDPVPIITGSVIVVAFHGLSLLVKSVDQIGASRSQALNNS